MRARLLRRAGVAHLGPVLDLGAGYGAVTGELRRRSAGPVIALDRRRAPLSRAEPPAVCADAAALPFADASFALVFAQLVFLWLPDLAAATAEVGRVLKPGGLLLAIEPDFGGAIEHPPAIAAAPLWRRGLEAAGANPDTGRHLATRLGAAGFSVQVELSPPPAADPDRLELLAHLVGERAVAPIRAADRETPEQQKLAFVPYFFITARRGDPHR